MKNIYFMISHTNTTLGKLIRFCSNYQYNHISVCDNSSLQPLYSFARYNYNSPFVGGFVEESILRYLYHGRSTKVRIYRIEVNEEQFEKYRLIIESHLKESKKYIYNTFGIFHSNIYSARYRQTCLSFAVSILKDLDILSQKADIRTIKKLEEHLSSFSHTDTILLNRENHTHVWGDDKYYERVPISKVLMDTCIHFYKLIFLFK